MPRLGPDALAALLGPNATACHRALTGEHGVALPPFTDHHVHLHLIDEHLLARNGIAGVVDLGGDPSTLARHPKASIPRVAYAGAFLTAPGGYPSGRDWAPAAIVREVHSASLSPGVAGGAATAVDEQAVFGASVIKVSLNADAGPVLAAEVLIAIVQSAHARGLPVVAHAQGAGMVELSLAVGIDALAHAPSTEDLSGLLCARAARSQIWISTIDIHSGSAREQAIGNLSKFVRAGGRVLYGTDLGNGDLPVGVNARELAAMPSGLDGPGLISALTDPWPAAMDHHDRAIATFVPGDPPSNPDDIPNWLARATVVPAEELIHDEH